MRGLSPSAARPTPGGEKAGRRSHNQPSCWRGGLHGLNAVLQRELSLDKQCSLGVQAGSMNRQELLSNFLCTSYKNTPAEEDTANSQKDPWPPIFKNH